MRSEPQARAQPQQDDVGIILGRQVAPCSAAGIGGGKVDVVMLDGPAGTGDPCEAASAHGFIGVDDAVVMTVTRWIAKQNLSAR